MSQCPEANLIAKENNLERRRILLEIINSGSWPQILRGTKLSQQEAQVLMEFFRGKDSLEISQSLGITANHVRVVLHNIRKKHTKFASEF